MSRDTIKATVGMSDKKHIASYESLERDDCFEITYKECTFKLLKPTTDVNYLAFVTLDTRNSIWLTKLNHYSLTRNPDSTKLLNKFQTLADKYLNNTSSGDVTSVKEFSGTEVAFHKEKSRLINLAENSHKDDTCAKNKKVKKIFNKNKVADIIINEYMTLWKFLQETSMGTLTIVDDSIYHWKVCLIKFKNTNMRQSMGQLKNNFGYEYVELHVQLNSVYYPNDPPVIKITRPRLSDSLMARISNSKQFNLDFWNPTTLMKDIVVRVHDILENHAKVNFNSEFNDISKHPLGAFMPIENVLIDLSTLVDSGETDVIDKNLTLFKASEEIKTSSNSETKAKYWNSGTGYGHTGSNKWDPAEYTRIQEERNEKIQVVFDRIIDHVQNINKDYNSFYASIKGSILIKYLKQQLKHSTLLDMHKHKETYQKYFTLLQTMCTEYGIMVYHEDSGDSLYTILMGLYEESKTSLEVDDTNVMANIIFTLGTMVDDVYMQYLQKLQSAPSSISQLDEKPSETIIKSKEVVYEEHMDKYKFILCDPIDQFKYPTESGNMSQCFKQLSVELPSLKRSLPVQYGASICVAFNKKEVNKHRYMITGPVDTPYENGCFIFDAYMCPGYPMKAPKFKFLNTGGQRFNPNLYDSGKVCLSILGTYIGPAPNASELWLPKESTLFQVVMSILGQILVEEPYFNEPGYERSRGTSSGDSSNANYNFNCRLYTMKSTIRDLLKDPNSYPEFKNAIKDHFRLKKDDVIKTCQKWVDEAHNHKTSKSSHYSTADTSTKTSYDTTFNEIKVLLNEL